MNLDCIHLGFKSTLHGNALDRTQNFGSLWQTGSIAESFYSLSVGYEMNHLLFTSKRTREFQYRLSEQS